MLGREFESPHLQRSKMTNNKVDVRIVKTKERLKDALFQLLKVKSLEKISISEICTLASVNRNTFYAHYSSLNSLLEEIEANLLESVLCNLTIDYSSNKSITEMMFKILECVKKNKEICSLLFSDNGDKAFLRTILMFAYPSSIKNWIHEYNIDETKATQFYYFVIGGVVNVIEDWINNDFEASSMELAKSINDMVLYGQNCFTR